MPIAEKKCPNGGTHTHFSLNPPNAVRCGPACISMVLNHTGHAGKGLDLDAILALCQQYDARGGLAANPFVAVTGPQIVAVLRNDFGYRHPVFERTTAASLKHRMRDSTEPIIVQVRLPSRTNVANYHWVIGLGRVYRRFGYSDYCFEDPLLGTRCQTIDDEARSTYKIADGLLPGRLTGNGEISGWHVRGFGA